LNHKTLPKEKITTALLLAAGMGNRLYPLTKNAPKCMTIVNDQSILERLISSLINNGFKRLVIVTGHLEDHIRDYLGDETGGIKIEYIFSSSYKTTNNIYSLWMARNTIKEPFLLLESDIVFNESLLEDMCYANRIAVAKLQPSMNGTCVTINQSQQVKTFLLDTADSHGLVKYKTVNIYSISLNSWNEIVRRLDKRISDGRVNDYYETVFAEMVDDSNLTFEMVSFDDNPWYEIDTIEDLIIAEKLFSSEDYKVIPAIPFSSPDMFITAGISTEDKTGI
jgi:choline kinase